MKISCPNCSAAYELDDKRVPAAGLSIKCPKCKNPFTVHKPKAGEAAAKPGKPPSAVPLPGQQGARPKVPAKPGAKLPPRPAAQSGAVPLPGSGDEAAASTMGAPPGAVPLPGLDEPPTQEEVAAGEAGGRVPLPGMGDEGSGMDQTAVDFRPPSRAGAQPSTGFGAVPLPGLDDKPQRPPADSGDPFSNLEMGGNEPAPASRPKAATEPSLDDVFSVDMPEPPAPKPPPAKSPSDGGVNLDFAVTPKVGGPPAGGDMLDFVDESPKPKEEKKRPPPPMIARRGAGEKEETLSLSEPPGEAAPSGPAGKDRKKAEREERAAKDREERARRKTARGPGVVGATILPALRESVTSPKRVVGVVVLLGLVAVVVLGLRARHTPAGIFWTNKFIPSKKAATATEAKVIEKGMERLSEGDFAGARDALGSSAQLLGVLPSHASSELVVVAPL